MGTQIGQLGRWLQVSARGSAIGGLVGGILAYVIYAIGWSVGDNILLCLAAGAVGRVVTWTISEAIIGLTLAQLVRVKD